MILAYVNNRTFKMCKTEKEALDWLDSLGYSFLESMLYLYYGIEEYDKRYWEGVKIGRRTIRKKK